MLKYKFYKILRVLHLISKKKFKKIEMKRNYKIISNSKFFDSHYYLNHNEDVLRAGIDPILHYLHSGWKEGRDCTPFFDGDEYLRKNINVYKNGICPLLHYELYGKYQKKDSLQPTLENNKTSYNDTAYMKEQIEKYDYISFDIFDTLLLRPYLRPTDLFEHLGRLNSVENFKEVRITAEKNARKYNSHKEDITLDDIYKQLPDTFKYLKEKELKLEETVLFANEEMLDIFKYARDLGKKIIITSDMYLPTAFLNAILIKNGFSGYYKTYISGDVQRGKGKTLFPYILKDLNIKPKDILHIGDNVNSDYKKPRCYGINAIHYKKVSDVFLRRNIKALSFWQKNDSFEASVLLMSLAVFNHNHREIDYWSRFGFEYGGPVCYWYLKWIESQLNDKKVDDIIFVARDGYALEKIFKLFEHNNIKTHYIYASRQLFINTHLDDAINDNRTLALINVFRDKDEEINKASYIIQNEDASREFVKNKYEKFRKLCNAEYNEYKNYIKNKNISGKNIAIVDTITGAASSMKQIKTFLPNSKISTFLWVCLESAKKYIDEFNIHTFSAFDNHKHITTWDIIEYIMAAPEFPILKIKRNKPIYQSDINDEEKERVERYKYIAQFSVKYAKYMETYFKNVLTFSEEFIVLWINLLFDCNSGYDRKYLGGIQVCADSSHSIMRPMYKKWATQQLPPLKNTDNSIRAQFDDLKSFMNRLIERKLSTMSMHQRTFLPFKNIHKGKDIVILASGPTLQYFQPMDDCIYIGVNQSYALHKAKLDYVFIQDFSGKTSGYLDEIEQLECIKFYGLTSENTAPFRTIPESVRIDAKAYPYRTDWEDIRNFKTEFAYDLSVQALGCGGTVVFPALQFALWTNPRRIYLVGADTTCQGYFDGNGKNFLIPNKLIPLYKRFKEFAKQYYPSIEIISINPIGLKGIFKDVYTNEFLSNNKS